MKTSNKSRTQEDTLCSNCKELKNAPINGFKTWNCKGCDKRSLANSSVIPAYCQSCANELGTCERCGVEIN